YLEGLPFNAACEGLALHILHHDEAVTGFFADFVDATDMRMIESCCCLCFPHEALPGLLTGNRILRNELDRDFAAERGVVGEINLPHPARAQFAQNAVMTDGLSFH